MPINSGNDPNDIHIITGSLRLKSAYASCEATGMFEPVGIRFKHESITKFQLRPAGMGFPNFTFLDNVGRIPVASGSVVHIAEITGALNCDFARGPNTGPGGVHWDHAEAVSAGYEVRLVSGSLAQALVMTPETASAFTLPSDNTYTYASDILWFIYQDDGANPTGNTGGGPAVMKFIDSGRTCHYGAFGPGSLWADKDDNVYAAGQPNFLVDGAINDTWAPFSLDSQVPRNAKTVDLGFHFGGDGSSVWQIALSGSTAAASAYGTYSGPMLLRVGSSDSDDSDETQDQYKTATIPMTTGTLVYRFQRIDTGNTGYMWVRGWSL